MYMCFTCNTNMTTETNKQTNKQSINQTNKQKTKTNKKKKKERKKMLNILVPSDVHKFTNTLVGMSKLELS